jgi:hypothetical protein
MSSQRRVLPSGQDVTEAYAEACTTSWRRFFSHVISVNSFLEKDLEIEELVRDVRYVPTDLMNQVGKPVTLFNDLLNEAHGYDLIGVINADIYLAGAVDDALRGLGVDTFVAERRTDVDTVDSTEGSLYPYGYDFFVLPAPLLPIVSGTDLALGVPWWDHFVPVSLILAGHRPTGRGTGLAFSLRHEERWDANLWVVYGRIFVRSVIARISFRMLLKPGVTRYAWTTVTSALLLEITRSPSIIKWALERVSQQNIRLVERFRINIDN